MEPYGCSARAALAGAKLPFFLYRDFMVLFIIIPALFYEPKIQNFTNRGYDLRSEVAELLRQRLSRVRVYPAACMCALCLENLNPRLRIRLNPLSQKNLRRSCRSEENSVILKTY
jgi:hypothetical protein